MRVHIGTDHAGFEIKQHLINELTATRATRSSTHGPQTYDADDDDPIYCLPAAAAVVADPDSLGIVIGGSGNGEAIAANKGQQRSAATDTAQLGRRHNKCQRHLHRRPITPPTTPADSSNCSSGLLIRNTPETHAASSSSPTMKAIAESSVAKPGAATRRVDRPRPHRRKPRHDDA